MRCVFVLLAGKGLTVGALALGRVRLVRAYLNGAQPAVIAVAAMVGALGNRALNRVICMTSIHKKCSSFVFVLLSCPPGLRIIHKK